MHHKTVNTETIFYTNADIDESILQTIQDQASCIKILAPQCYVLDQDGFISGGLDSQCLTLCKRYQIKIMPLIMNIDFDMRRFHTFLLNLDAQEQALEKLVLLCKENEYVGIQFDFEHIHVSDKSAYTDFCTRAAVIFHAQGLLFSIAVMARTDDGPGHTMYKQWLFEHWSGVFDYAALANVTDFISLMTYDQHRKSTPPGPVAGYPWIEAVLRYASQYIPNNKISLGIPGYSCHWFATAAHEQDFYAGYQVTHGFAHSLLREHCQPLIWDDQEKVHMAIYSNDHVRAYIFLEDARSFQEKFKLVHKYNLRGFSFWRLGTQDPLLWDVFASIPGLYITQGS